MSSKLSNLGLLLALGTVAISGQAIAAESSSDVEALFKKADGLHTAQKFKEAGDTYREIIRLEPGSAKAHQRLGAVLAAQGSAAADANAQKDLDETAILEEKQAIKLDPKFHLPHIVLGQIYANRNNNEEAIKEFKAAIEIKPDSYRSHLDLGIAYARAGKDEEALKANKRAVEIKPEIPTAYINLGVVQQSLGDFKGAAESVKKALTLKCNPQEVHIANFNLGNIYCDAKEPDQAIAAYQAALKIIPNHPLSLSGIGWMQALKGENDAAIATQRRVLKQKIDPVTEGIVRGRLASALAAKGLNEEAEKEFKKCSVLKPSNVLSMMEYGKYLEKGGRKSEAKQIFEKALMIQPTFKPAKEALAKLDGKSETK